MGNCKWEMDLRGVMMALLLCGLAGWAMGQPVYPGFYVMERASEPAAVSDAKAIWIDDSGRLHVGGSLLSVDGHTHALNDLSDVSAGIPTNNYVLKYITAAGPAWVPSPDLTDDTVSWSEISGIVGTSSSQVAEGNHTHDNRYPTKFFEDDIAETWTFQQEQIFQNGIDLRRTNNNAAIEIESAPVLYYDEGNDITVIDVDAAAFGNLAGEGNRFTGAGGFQFQMTAGTSEAFRFQRANTPSPDWWNIEAGNLYLKGIGSASTSNLVYVNTSTGLLSYGSAGSMASQSASSVNILGGSASGLTTVSSTFVTGSAYVQAENDVWVDCPMVDVWTTQSHTWNQVLFSSANDWAVFAIPVTPGTAFTQLRVSFQDIDLGTDGVKYRIIRFPFDDPSNPDTVLAEQTVGPQVSKYVTHNISHTVVAGYSYKVILRANIVVGGMTQIQPVQVNTTSRRL